MYKYKRKINWKNVTIIALVVVIALILLIGQSLNREVCMLRLSNSNIANESDRLFDELKRTKSINNAYEREILALQSELSTYE